MPTNGEPWPYDHMTTAELEEHGEGLKNQKGLWAVDGLALYFLLWCSFSGAFFGLLTLTLSNLIFIPWITGVISVISLFFALLLFITNGPPWGILNNRQAQIRVKRELKRRLNEKKVS